MSQSSRPPVLSPRRLAHTASRTNRLADMMHWYDQVLGAHLAYGSDKVAFLTYDEEHHRIALLALDDYPTRPQDITAGHYHTASAYGSLAEPSGTYLRLRDQGILAYRIINHGPAVSMCYPDPEAHQIELQVDSFPDAEATNAWMRSDAFRRGPIGIEFEAEEMLARLRSAVSEAELMRRPDSSR